MKKLYEVVLKGQILGRDNINRWNYVLDGDTISSPQAFTLATAMGFAPVSGAFPADTIAAKIAAVINIAVTWSSCQVRAIYDPTDFIDIPFSPVVPGNIDATELLPATICWAFRTNRVRTDIGRGQKRFSGVDKGSLETEEEPNSGAITALTNLADLMGDQFTVTEGAATAIFKPCVVKKFPYTSPHGKLAYRYANADDGGEAAQIEQLAVGVEWELVLNTSTQNSRKKNKGR